MMVIFACWMQRANITIIKCQYKNQPREQYVIESNLSERITFHRYRDTGVLDFRKRSIFFRRYWGIRFQRYWYWVSEGGYWGTGFTLPQSLGANYYMTITVVTILYIIQPGIFSLDPRQKAYIAASTSTEFSDKWRISNVTQECDRRMHGSQKTEIQW